MTVVTMGRNKYDEPMMFQFNDEIEAYIFLSGAKDSYAEDDFVIEMENEDE